MAKRKKVDNRRISELRNLGPTCEQDLNAVGIHTAEALKAMGAEAAFLQLLAGRKQRKRSVKCRNAAYLYALYGAIHDLDWRELPEQKKAEFKQLTAELRDSGRFS